MNIKILSKSKSDKSIIVEKENTKEEILVNDILIGIMDYLKKHNLSLNDIKSITALPSESFTGYREAVTISNMFNYFLLKKDLKSLQYPKYHKKPNINISV